LIELFNRINQADMLARKDAYIAARGAELARVTQELTAERGAAAAELARARQELATERNAVARLAAASAAQAADLDAMRASPSWRITRPLRFVADAARLLVRPLRSR
jgi:hypothetical protein